MHSKV